MKAVLDGVKGVLQMLLAGLLILLGTVIRDPFTEEEVALVAAKTQEQEEKRG